MPDSIIIITTSETAEYNNQCGLLKYQPDNLHILADLQIPVKNDYILTQKNMVLW